MLVAVLAVKYKQSFSTIASAERPTSKLIWPLDNPIGDQTKIVGQYPNGYFGSAIAQGDINGDGFEDLIVSARNIPQYSKGRVYVLPCLLYTSPSPRDPE